MDAGGNLRVREQHRNVLEEPWDTRRGRFWSVLGGGTAGDGFGSQRGLAVEELPGVAAHPGRRLLALRVRPLRLAALVDPATVGHRCRFRRLRSHPVRRRHVRQDRLHHLRPDAGPALAPRLRPRHRRPALERSPSTRTPSTARSAPAGSTPRPVPTSPSATVKRTPCPGCRASPRPGSGPTAPTTGCWCSTRSRIRAGSSARPGCTRAPATPPPAGVVCEVTASRQSDLAIVSRSGTVAVPGSTGGR